MEKLFFISVTKRLQLVQTQIKLSITGKTVKIVKLILFKK